MRARERRPFNSTLIGSAYASLTWFNVRRTRYAEQELGKGWGDERPEWWDFCASDNTSECYICTVGARYKLAKIQNIGPRPYILKPLLYDSKRGITRTERNLKRKAPYVTREIAIAFPIQGNSSGWPINWPIATWRRLCRQLGRWWMTASQLPCNPPDESQHCNTRGWAACFSILATIPNIENHY